MRKDILQDKAQYCKGHRERLREKFINSFDQSDNSCLQEREILELLLFYVYPRCDVEPLARELLRINKNLYNVLYMQREHPLMSKGLHILCKLFRCLLDKSFKAAMQSTTVLSSWSSVIEHLRATMSNLKVEYFKVLFLNAKYELIKDEVLSNGSEHILVVSPRELVKKILFYNAKCIVIVHNHPSGNLLPSDSDIITTKHLIEICNIFEIMFIDHIIIAGDYSYSFKEHGLI
ncbi:MAG: JAB domain-containing protein [Pseudomonadota bacterium]